MMEEEDFARLFGYKDWGELHEHTETLYREGFLCSWYISLTKDGRWGAWDNAEIAKDRIEWYDTRQEAVKYMEECWEESEMLWEDVKRDMEMERDYQIQQEESINGRSWSS